MPQELSRQQHTIGVAAANDFIRMAWLRDEPDGAGGNVRLPANAARERDLVSRSDGNLSVRNRPTRRAVDQVDAALPETARERHRIVDGPTSGHPVRCRQADEEGQPFRPRLSDRADYFE